MVRSGLVTAWRLAGCPTSRSPSSVKATIEGVVRMPSAFSITFGVLPSITATHELVVPRSIPMTLPMALNSSFLRQVGRVLAAPDRECPRERRAHSSDPLNAHRRRPLRRLGSYRRAPLGRKPSDHGFASSGVNRHLTGVPPAPTPTPMTAAPPPPPPGFRL